jgi:hypothetical protein
MEVTIDTIVPYDPGRFSDIANGPLGPKLWEILNRSDNIVRMETATMLECVAVEPLGPVLLRELGDDVRVDRVKQTVGHMVRQVLERLGYRIDRNNVRIPRPGLFTSGTRYVPKDKQ